MHRPKVVFLDEPTAGVDPISRREFWTLIYAMAKEGVTVLVTTHYMDEAELCQRVGFITQGRLVAIDTPGRLKQTQMRGDVLEISVSDPDAAMRVLKAAQQSGKLPLDEVALYGAQVHAVVPSAQQYKQVIRDLLAAEGIGVRSIEWIAPTLEDVFISSVNAPELKESLMIDNLQRHRNIFVSGQEAANGFGNGLSGLLDFHSVIGCLAQPEDGCYRKRARLTL